MPLAFFGVPSPQPKSPATGLDALPQRMLCFDYAPPVGAQKYGLVEDIEVDARGLAHAPTARGWEAKIDFALIEREKTAVLR